MGYEPRTFVLERRDGRVVEACTPDFYLPDLDTYVECTCMDQRLVSKKNRKYRKLEERFGVVVEIMYRRDFIRLGRVYGLTELLRAASSNGVMPDDRRLVPAGVAPGAGHDVQQEVRHPDDDRRPDKGPEAVDVEAVDDPRSQEEHQHRHAEPGEPERDDGERERHELEHRLQERVQDAEEQRRTEQVADAADRHLVEDDDRDQQSDRVRRPRKEK
jgi:hypothetical protein